MSDTPPYEPVANAPERASALVGITWGQCWVPGPDDDNCDLVAGHSGPHASVSRWPVEATWTDITPERAE